MTDASGQWRELKARFLREFIPSEQLFFLKKVRESVMQKGYPAGEDLFNYCYFLTLRERMQTLSIGAQGGEGYMRFLLVESRKEIETEITVYKKKLEGKKLPVADEAGHKLLEYLSL